MGACKDLFIAQGRTFSQLVRWETTPVVYRAITSIAQTAPARLTVPAHGCPDGWRAAVTGVKGMHEINAEANHVGERDYHAVTVVDADTIEFNAVDASLFRPYVSGGYLQYNTPMTLTGFIGRMKIKDRIGGRVLASSEAEDAPLDVIQVTVDAPVKAIRLTISASATEIFEWRHGVYDLEMVSPDAEPVVTCLLSGRVIVGREVTD
jgi:hypothetical protein